MFFSSITPSFIRSAVKILKDGGVVVFPTETSYGIGCDATNPAAVRRICRMKNRPSQKGLPVMVDSFLRAKQYVVFSKTAELLANKRWPGAFTLVLPLRKRGRACPVDCLSGSPLANVPPMAGRRRACPSEALKERRRAPVAREVLKNRELAIRVSSHPVARTLARGLKRPLVATSANVSGRTPCYSVRALHKQWPLGRGEKMTPDMVLDAGALPRRKPSKIVRVEKDGDIRVLRD
jgi:L-threonylcarbamoyladenylate synthase